MHFPFVHLISVCFKARACLDAARLYLMAQDQTEQYNQLYFRNHNKLMTKVSMWLSGVLACARMEDGERKMQWLLRLIGSWCHRLYGISSSSI
jgi:hypothetical protein